MVWLLCGYMWLFIHRPFEIWPWLGDLRAERVYMLLVIACWLVSPKRFTSNRLNAAFLTLFLGIIACWIISPYRAEGTKLVEDYLKIGIFYLLVVTSVRGEQDLRRLVTAFVASVGLYMAHSFYEYLCGRHVWRMGTARMMGVDLTYNDPNTFAASVVYALPMVLPLWREAHTRRLKAVVASYVGLSATCVLLTGSRTGLIGFVALTAVAVAASRHRFRIALGLALAVPVIWALVPADRQARYLTIFDSSSGPENAKASADARAEYFWISLDLWKQRPVTGWGPGGFAIESGTGQPAHTLYGQVVSELGAVGVVSLLWVLGCFALNGLEMRRLRRRAAARPPAFAADVSRAVGVTVFLLLLLGVGGHNLYRYTWLWFGAFQAVALQIARSAAPRPAAVAPVPLAWPAGRAAPLRPQNLSTA